MPLERPPLKPSSTTDPTIPSQRPNHEPEHNITALPQIGYPETDPWAKYRRPSTDTIDDIPTPPPHPHPTLTAIEQTPDPSPSTTLPPPYTTRQNLQRKSRFPVKAQTISTLPPPSTRTDTITVNGTPSATLHDIPLDPNEDNEKAKLATQYKGLQGGWHSRKWKLVISAGFAVVVTTVVIVTALELSKKHPEDFGKI